MVCHKTYYITLHQHDNTCSHCSKLQSSRTNSCLPVIHSQTFLHFIPTSVIVLASPPLAVSCWVSILSLFDLSAAFDTTDHSIPTSRLIDCIRLLESQAQPFSSYILDRFQVVVVNSISSTPQCLDFGVPRGSVLGPMLFVLYTQWSSSGSSRIGRLCHRWF